MEIVGWPADGPTLALHHERFSYAGKFVMSNTGKAVARLESGSIDLPPDVPTDASATGTPAYETDVVAAVAFNEDRTDADTCWIRYVTVERDHRGQGIGPRLTAHVRDAARDRGYDRLRIAVNNPYAYDALWKAGFGFTGRTTGLAELVLEHPADDPASYRRGLERFQTGDRSLSSEEVAFVRDRLDRGPPDREG